MCVMGALCRFQAKYVIGEFLLIIVFFFLMVFTRTEGVMVAFKVCPISPKELT